MKLKREDLHFNGKAIIEEIKTLEDSSRIGVLVRSISRTGMSRRMKVFYITDDRRYEDITDIIACVTGNSFNPNNRTIKVNGCGMDMAFAMLYDFYRQIFKGSNDCDQALQRANKYTSMN